jgi:hypothetical protein
MKILDKSMSLVGTVHTNKRKYRLEEEVSWTWRHATACTMTYMSSATCVHHHMGIHNVYCLPNTCMYRQTDDMSGEAAAQAVSTGIHILL